MLPFISAIMSLGFLSILIGAVIHTLRDLGAIGMPHFAPYSDVDDDQYEEELGGSVSPTVARNAEFVAETARRTTR